MDIKWKKWNKVKGVIGITAFVLGWNAVLYAVFGFLGSSGWYRYYGPGIVEERFERDYQNTSDFRSYMGNMLETFLSMAEGKPGGAYWYDSYENGSSEVIEDSMETAVAMAAESAETWSEEYGWEEKNNPHNLSEEEAKAEADRIHERLKQDKNLLYTITRDGKVIYTNADGQKLDGKIGTIPEGYNFLMYFDGSKVNIVKDGKEVSVYGDGYYREDSEWYVPGYRNFVPDEGMEQTTVCMAAAAEPHLYSGAVLRSGRFSSFENELYYIAQRVEELSRENENWRNALTVGAFLLILWLVLKKDKKRADAVLASLTGKMVMEVKLLILLLAGAGMTACYYGSDMFWNTWQEYGYEVTVAESPTAMAMVSADMVREIMRYPAALIAFLWVVAILINDLRKNKDSWKHSLTYRLASAMNARQLTLPASRRLVRRYIPVFAGSLIFGVLTIITIFIVSIVTYYGEISWFLPIACLLAGMGAVVFLQYRYLSKMKVLAGDLELLSERISSIHAGKYEDEICLSPKSDLAKEAAELEDIRKGMAAAIEEQVKSGRLKVELIANVSHDIKTPLTSIISYVELLKQEENLPEHIRDYVSILDDKSQRLKNMVQDVFTVSKAASGLLPVEREKLDLGKLLRQTIADMEEPIRQSRLAIKKDIPEAPIFIEADGQKLYRVFQNLIQNALQYSLEGSRIYISLHSDGTAALASVKNTSRMEINKAVDFTERFQRGDESRTDGGSGLGLSIAQSFTEACGGTFHVDSVADLFVVSVAFPMVSFLG